MVSELVFYAVLLCLATQRVLELRKSRRNEQWLRAEGAREHTAGQYRLMQGLHVAWFASMIVEVRLLRTPFVLSVASIALAGTALGQTLRYAAMRALGKRWSVRIWTLPGQRPVSSGIYRYIRHPNYLGVALELACVPLLHGAWRTAICFSVANGALLAWRIRAEERALALDNHYESELGDRPRFVPPILALGRARRSS